MAEETRFKSVHPVIPVRDMAGMITFYEDKLGFRKVFDNAAKPGDAINYAGVHRGGQCLYFQTVTPGDDPTMPQIRIRVENIEPLYEEYKAEGVIHSGGQLELKPWGSKDFVCTTRRTRRWSSSKTSRAPWHVECRVAWRSAAMSSTRQHAGARLRRAWARHP